MRIERFAFALSYLLCLSTVYAMSADTSNPALKRKSEDISGEAEVWDGSDKESFYSLEHPGYTLESDKETHTGGWHAHRAAWEPVDGVQLLL